MLYNAVLFAFDAQNSNRTGVSCLSHGLLEDHALLFLVASSLFTLISCLLHRVACCAFSRLAAMKNKNCTLKRAHQR